MKHAVLPTIVLLAMCAASPARADEPKLIQYKLEADIHCDDLAEKFWGDRERYDLIHKYNRDLGPAPHTLKAGTILTLPPPTVTHEGQSPDARLQIVRNQVSVEAPSSRPGKVNDALFRGNRVGTAESSSAEVGFRDDTTLWLGERSLVVILGDSRSKVGQATGTTLVNGNLRAFLAASAGKGIDVKSGNAHALVGAGESQVSIDGKKTTRLAVYKGSSALSSAGKTTSVTGGFGSKAENLKPPTPPKPLPAAPVWSTSFAPLYLSTQPTIDIFADYTQIAGAPRAATFHVQLAKDAAFHDLIVDAKVPATVARVDARGVGAGDYFARVSVIDGDEFEGAYATPIATHVAPIEPAPPGSSPHAAEFLLTPGFFCSVDGGPFLNASAHLVLTRTRQHQVACATDPAGANATTITVPSEPLHPKIVDAAIARTPHAPSSGTLTFVLVDGNGAHLDDVALSAALQGATPDGPARTIGQGRYAIPISWSNADAKIIATLTVNDSEITVSNVITVARGATTSASSASASAKAASTNARKNEQIDAQDDGAPEFVGAIDIGAIGDGLATGALGASIGVDFRVPIGTSQLRVGGRLGYERVLSSGDERDLIPISLPVSFRFGDARLRPTIAAAPLVLRSVSGSSNDSAFLGGEARAGVELVVGKGELFLDAGYRLTTKATDASVDLSGIVGSLGYRQAF